MKQIYAILDRLFGNETEFERKKESNVGELQSVEYLLPPLVESLFDPIQYNMEEERINSNIHERIERRKTKKNKPFYNLQCSHD